MCVILVRQFAHPTNHFFSATQFNRGLSESCITDEPIVNAQEISLLAFLLELIRDEVLVIPFFLPVAETVGSTFLDVVVGNRKEVKSELEVLLVSYVSSRKKCPHVQQTMPTSQYDRHTLHCALGSTSSSSHSSVFPAALIKSRDSLLKRLNCRCC